jgi:hypothetical protein
MRVTAAVVADRWLDQAMGLDSAGGFGKSGAAAGDGGANLPKAVAGAKRKIGRPCVGLSSQANLKPNGSWNGYIPSTL